MHLNRKQLRLLIESVILNESEGKLVSQKTVLEILNQFFGYMQGIRMGSDKEVRSFYKIMQDNNIGIDNKDLEVLFARLNDNDAGHQLGSGKAGSDTQSGPNKYSLDRKSYDILLTMNKIRGKLSDSDFKLDPKFDLFQKSSIAFKQTYQDINSQDKNYLTIPEIK